MTTKPCPTALTFAEFKLWVLFRLQVSKIKKGSPSITPEGSSPLCLISYENQQMSMFTCPNLPQTKYLPPA